MRASPRRPPGSRCQQPLRDDTIYMPSSDGSQAEAAIGRLCELIEESRAVLPFTGAGISTECGIPDFRSPGGLWTKYRPIGFDDFMASQDMRDESWRRRLAMD